MTSSATLGPWLLTLVLSLLIGGALYIGLLAYKRRRHPSTTPGRLPKWVGPIVRAIYLAVFVVALVVLLAISLPSQAPTPPRPSDTASPTVTHAPPQSPSPSGTPPSGASEVTVWKYDPDRFNDVTGHWRAANWGLSDGSSVYALGTTTRGCGARSLRQIRYPALPEQRSKTLQFSVGLTADSVTPDTPIAGKMQYKLPGADEWSEPQTFRVKFGQVKTIRFSAGNATEILVSLYPDEATCQRANVGVVEFNAQIELRG